MHSATRCPECGASLPAGSTCEDQFHLMLAWEFGDPKLFGAVHNLMVLCYHLQHPSLYSSEGLIGAERLLVDFLERGVTPAGVRRREHGALDSGRRGFRIGARSNSRGAYDRPVRWTMTAGDVTAADPSGYCDSVRRWARSVLDDLRASGNLPSD